MALVTDYAFTGFEEAVVVDVETTGLDPKADRVVSIAALRADFSKLKINEDAKLETFQALLNPQTSIPKEASRIHGITDDDVKNEEGFSEIADTLRDFIGDLPIIGHNIQFDKAFLSSEFKRAGVKTLHRNRSYCTMKRIRDHYSMTGKRARNPNLEEAANLFSIEPRTGEHHDATEDALMALKIAVALYDADTNQGMVQKPQSRKEYHSSKNSGPERHYEEDYDTPPTTQQNDEGSNWTVAVVLMVVVVIAGAVFFG